MLADIASWLTSPLVHSPLLYIWLKVLSKVTSAKRTFGYLSFIPVVWFFSCSINYPSALLMKFFESQYQTIPIDSRSWKETDAIVVLACNYYEDKALPYVSRWPACSLKRNLHAVNMYKAHPKPIFLAGGILGEDDIYPQATHNREFLKSMGIEEKDIFDTPKGFNTESEVAALSKHLQGQYISLVTSASHLPRAVKYFEMYNIKVLPIPVDHLNRSDIKPDFGLPSAKNLYRSERAIHEFLGLAYQRIFL